jgi:hypothetical protein
MRSGVRNKRRSGGDVETFPKCLIIVNVSGLILEVFDVCKIYNCDIVCCDTVQTCGWVQTFRRKSYLRDFDNHLPDYVTTQTTV